MLLEKSEKSGRLFKRNRFYGEIFEKQGIQGLSNTCEDTDVPRIEVKQKGRQTLKQHGNRQKNHLESNLHRSLRLSVFHRQGNKDKKNDFPFLMESF